MWITRRPISIGWRHSHINAALPRGLYNVWRLKTRSAVGDKKTQKQAYTLYLVELKSLNIAIGKYSLRPLYSHSPLINLFSFPFSARILAGENWPAIQLLQSTSPFYPLVVVSMKSHAWWKEWRFRNVFIEDLCKRKFECIFKICLQF